MNPNERPVSQSSCLLAALALIILFGLLAMAFALAIRGEVSWDRGAARDRVFLVLEESARGVGLESVRPVTAPGGSACSRTRVRYLLWKGSGENVEYCECGGEGASSCP